MASSCHSQLKLVHVHMYCISTDDLTNFKCFKCAFRSDFVSYLTNEAVDKFQSLNSKMVFVFLLDSLKSCNSSKVHFIIF